MHRVAALLPWVFFFFSFCSHFKVTIYFLKNIALLLEFLRPWMCYEPCKLPFSTFKNNNHDQQLNLKFVSPQDRPSQMKVFVPVRSYTDCNLVKTAEQCWIIICCTVTLTHTDRIQSFQQAFSFSIILLCFFSWLSLENWSNILFWWECVLMVYFFS